MGRRTGDIDSLYAATKLVEKELGWQAKFTMKDMCEYIVKTCASKSLTRHMRSKIHSYHTRYASLMVSGSDLWTWQQKNPKGYNPNKENK